MTAARSIWHLSGDGASDRRELVVRLPIKTTNPLNGSHQHWSVKARTRKQQRFAVRLALETACRLEGIAVPCRVTLTRLAPSSGLDGDGLQASLKAVRDGVADALGVDDRDARVTWAYDQRRSAKGEPRWGVEIRITKGAP